MMPVRQQKSFDFQIRHRQAWFSGCTSAVADKGGMDGNKVCTR